MIRVSPRGKPNAGLSFQVAEPQTISTYFLRPLSAIVELRIRTPRDSQGPNSDHLRYQCVGTDARCGSADGVSTFALLVFPPSLNRNHSCRSATPLIRSLID